VILKLFEMHRNVFLHHRLFYFTVFIIMAYICPIAATYLKYIKTR